MPRIASCRLVGTQRRAVLLGALLPFMPLFAARAGVTESHKLTASDELPGDRFGAAVALDGDLAVVGMPAAAAQSGAAYVYRFDGSSWIEEAKLTAADADPGDEFGRAVAVDGDRLVIGAPFDSEVAILAGAAYLFQFDGQTWTQQAKIVAPDGAAADQFGHAVSIDGPSILVGILGGMMRPEGHPTRARSTSSPRTAASSRMRTRSRPWMAGSMTSSDSPWPLTAISPRSALTSMTPPASTPDRCTCTAGMARCGRRRPNC